MRNRTILSIECDPPGRNERLTGARSCCSTITRIISDLGQKAAHLDAKGQTASILASGHAQSQAILGFPGIDPLQTAAAIIIDDHILRMPHGHFILAGILHRCRGRIVFNLRSTDLRPADRAYVLGLWHKFDLVFGNLQAFQQFIGPVNTLRQLTEMNERGALGQSIICTEGWGDSWIIDFTGKHHIPGVPSSQVNTTGCFDGFVATFVAATEARHTISRAARMAAFIAADIATGPGSLPHQSPLQLLKDAGLMIKLPRDCRSRRSAPAA